jgi:hypothetical protein
MFADRCTSSHAKSELAGITSDEQTLHLTTLPMGKFNQELMQNTKNCASDNYDIKDISPQLLNLFPLPHLRQRILQFKEFLVDHRPLLSGLV